MRDGRDEIGLGTGGRDGDRREGNGMGVMGWGQEGGMETEGRNGHRRVGWEQKGGKRDGIETGGRDGGQEDLSCRTGGMRWGSWVSRKAKESFSGICAEAGSSVRTPLGSC